MEAGGESIPRLYTRTGDRGTTGLSGGARVEKDSARIRAYGAYDELGTHLGAAYARVPPELSDVRAVVRRLQHELFIAQAELARAPDAPTSRHRIEERQVHRLESDIDRFESTHPPLRNFVLASGAEGAVALQVCRTVARRAERELIALHHAEALRPELLAWGNRVSDLLFALAVAVNHALGEPEIAPDYTV